MNAWRLFSFGLISIPLGVLTVWAAPMVWLKYIFWVVICAVALLASVAAFTAQRRPENPVLKLLGIFLHISHPSATIKPTPFRWTLLLTCYALGMTIGMVWMAWY